MVTLSYMLDTARVNGKSVWCFKNQMKISKKSSKDFGPELVKKLAMPHMQSRSLNGLKSNMQWKIKMFLGAAFEFEEPLFVALILWEYVVFVYNKMATF